jgi:hypothetical protein
VSSCGAAIAVSGARSFGPAGQRACSPAPRPAEGTRRQRLAYEQSLLLEGADRNRTGGLVRARSRANLWAWIERQAADAVRLYRPRFDVGDAL